MNLSKSFLKVGGLTGVSRIFGYVRDALIASFLGAGRLSDIFFMAFRIPNLLRNLVAEGALQVSFVPIFTEEKHKDEKRAWDFARNTFSWLMMLLLFITILAEIFMPAITVLFAPGFMADPEKLQMTIILSRIMFLYLITISGVAFLSSVLNTFSEFALTTAMPIVLNSCMILGLLFAHRFGGSALYWLSWAVVIAGILQMGILLNRIRKKKLGLYLVRPRFNNSMKKLLKRLGPGIVGTGVYNLNILIGSIIASQQNGAVSWLYYSDRLVQLPMAMIGIAVGTVLIVSISNALSEKNMEEVYSQQNYAIRYTMFWTFPAMIALLAMTRPIIQVLFERGAFSFTDTIYTANAVLIMAFAIPAMILSQIFSMTIFSSQDTKTPVMTSIVSMVIGTVLAIILFPKYQYLAIAYGTLVGAWVKVLTMIYFCRVRNLFQLQFKTIKVCAVYLILAILMGFLIRYVWAVLPNASSFEKLFSLGIACMVGGISYLITARFAKKFL